MKKKKSVAYYVLLTLHLLQGLGGLAGGIVLMISPNGSLIHMPLSMIKGSPFHDFLIPGIILFLILGVLPIFTFAVLIAQSDWSFLNRLNIYKDRNPAWMLSLFTGLGLIIWIDVEVAITGYGSILQAVYAAVGLLIVIFTLVPSVMKYNSRLS